MSELPLSPDQYSEDFAEISQIVKKNYSLYESKHIDIDALSASYAERIGKLSTGEEYGKTLCEYFGLCKWDTQTYTSMSTETELSRLISTIRSS